MPHASAPPRHLRARPRRLSLPLRWLLLAALTVPLLAGVSGVGERTAEAAPGSPAGVAVRFAASGRTVRNAARRAGRAQHAVAAVQRRLAANQRCLTIDGEFGPRTRAAVVAFSAIVDGDQQLRADPTSLRQPTYLQGPAGQLGQGVRPALATGPGVLGVGGAGQWLQAGQHDLASLRLQQPLDGDHASQVGVTHRPRRP